MPPKLLGEGGYGTVTLENGLAVKHYDKTRHLVQEGIIACYMRDSEYTVKVKGINFDKLTMSLELWSGSLQQVLQAIRVGTEPPLSISQQHSIFKCVLSALADFHNRKSVHADVKTSNILVDSTRTKAVLADYGLTSISNRAKAQYTTEQYSPTDLVISYRSHDLFGLAIVGLRLFTGYRANCTLSRHSLRTVIREQMQDSTLRRCLLGFVADNHLQCMRPEDAYKALYSRPLRLLKLPELEVATCKPHLYTAAEATIKELKERYKFHRAKRCLLASSTLIAGLDIGDPKKAAFYAGVMAYVYATIFSNKPIATNEIIAILKTTQEKLNAALATIIAARPVINITLAP